MTEKERTELERDELVARALRRPVRDLAVPSFARVEERLRQRRAALGPIAAAIAFAVVVGLVVGTALEQRRAFIGKPDDPASPVATAASCPPPSAAPRPIPTGPPAGGIEAYPLGVLCGEYVFVLNGGAITTPGAVAEMWAVPLAGGEPRLAVRYVNATTPATSTGENVLGRQLSPDGQRLVLSVATPRPSGGERLSLFIVDLETGRMRMVGSDDAADHERPAWSPDGNRIAYTKRPILGDGRGFDDGIWLMNVDGSGARQVVPPGNLGFGSRAYLYGWTPDGRVAWSYGWPATLTLTDVTSGGETRIGTFVGDFQGFSFRRTAPRIAGSFTERMNCAGMYVLVTDGAPESILVREPDRPGCPNVSFRNVRWSPTRDEVLYVRENLGTSELYIHERTGRAQRIAIQAEPVLAEWSTGGTHLLYIHRGVDERLAMPPHGSELRYVLRDGSGDRLIFAPPGLASLSDLAVRLYP